MLHPVPELAPNPGFDPRFLEALAEHGQAEYDIYKDQKARHAWSYHDILTRDVLHELTGRPPVRLERWAELAYIGNLVVEEGLPEYNRVTGEVFRSHPVFRQWNNSWTRDEHQHAPPMLEIAKARGLIDIRRTNEVIEDYLDSGLTLSFDDAAFGLAYPALQENATRTTHNRVRNHIPEEEAEARAIMTHIVGDEGRHERFYGRMVHHALHESDPDVASHQMRALARAVLGFAMPGVESDIRLGKRITAAYAKTGIFTLSQVAKEVLQPAIEGGKFKWNVADVTTLDDNAKVAQVKLVDFGEKLKKADGDPGDILHAISEARDDLGVAA